MMDWVAVLCCVLWRVSIGAQSSIVILLLDFEAIIKGIILDDHTGISRIAIASRGIVFVLVEAEHILLVQPQFVTTSMVE
jgi:hypothetical protein